MRRIPIRLKLVGALAVPLTALIVVTTLEVAASARDAAEVREQRDLAESSIGPVSLLSVLENERNAAAVYLLDQQDAFALPVEDNAEARSITDGAVADLRAEVEARGGAVEEAYAPALARMDELTALRDEIDASPDDARSLTNITAVSQYFDRYTELMDDLFAANKRVALAIDDPELRRGAELIDLSGRQTNLIAILVRDMLLAAVGGEAPDGLNQPEEIAPVAQSLGQLRSNEELIDTKATGDYRQLAADLFAAEEIQRFPEVVDQAIATSEVDLDGTITYSAGEDPETYGYTVFREGVTDVLTQRADELDAAATARQRWFIVLAATAIGTALLVTYVVSRSITRPLRSLTRQAKDMAERRLPDAVIDILETPLGDDVQVPTVEPVVVRTRDEVADVSTALNTVQDTALDLAVEQAVLRRNIADSFVNLGRRNQNLLGRQLDFITELESNETDADTLANLFRLDHLATRMRRNAESLLVLAGIEPPRKWAAPVRLTDVIRAALGEVEDYQRVTVRGVEPATIIGNAAADLAHLLAELIENALVFSPPDQTVDIRGRTNPDRYRSRPEGAESAERDLYRCGYTLAIIDSGLGMPTTDITAANRRLAGAESFTIAPSKYLGHYVAGNLAARHNIHVTLDNSPGNGVTATIDLPPTLLTTDNAIPATDEPHAARDVWPPTPTTPPLAAGRPASTPPPPALRPARPAPAPAPASSATGWPAPAAPFAPVAGTPPTAAPAGARTASGLTKRGGRPGATGTPVPGPSPDVLASMSRVTGISPSVPSAPPVGPPPSARRPAATAPPGPAPRPTATGLARRVPGAQIPDTAPVSLRRGTPSTAAAPLTAGQRSANEVYSFLTQFSDGVRRGLDRP